MKSVQSVFRRIVVLLLLVLCTSLGLVATPAQAGVLDQIEQVYSSVKTGGKEAFCRKANVASGSFSVRSFDGTLCSNSRTIAALSQYVCPSIADFSGSSCDSKGKNKLGGADPLTALKEEAKSAAGTTKLLINKLVPGV
ncbi:hypothetical protein [Microcoleus sp. D3_18a_C4]|uniref:hypothetical protein n=1 Tax=Microcoleus sp. D3_18a_C4 TaxID=3055332 RepID=UPI002FD37BFB